MKPEEYFSHLVKAYTYYHPISKDQRKAKILKTLERMEKKAEKLQKLTKPTSSSSK